MILFRLYSFPLEVESSGIGNTGPVFTWYQNKICSIRFCISLQIKHINCRLKQPTLIMVSLTPIKGMTEAVSASLDANKSSFVPTYVTARCCEGALEESSLALRTCRRLHSSVEQQRVYLSA